ncbi:polysaccharide deacetylase family protein [Actinophytocola sp. KF-1]
MVAAGHRVGNHTMTHPHMTGLTAPLIADEALGAQRVIRQAGADPRPLFRFPFGERDARTIDAVNELGYLPVRWTVDTLGWKAPAAGSRQRSWPTASSPDYDRTTTGRDRADVHRCQPRRRNHTGRRRPSCHDRRDQGQRLPPRDANV